MKLHPCSFLAVLLITISTGGTVAYSSDNKVGVHQPQSPSPSSTPQRHRILDIPAWRSSWSGYSKSHAPAGLDLAIVIDRSWSMHHNDPDASSKQFARKAAQSMLQNDSGVVISFDTKATALTPLTTRKNDLITAIDAVERKGKPETNISSGINLALQTLTANAKPNGIKAVLLLTDGQGKLANTADVRLSREGISVLAVGSGNSIRKSPLRKLAQTTGGQYGEVRSQANIPTELLRHTERSSNQPPVTPNPPPAKLVPADTLITYTGLGESPVRPLIMSATIEHASITTPIDVTIQVPEWLPGLDLAAGAPWSGESDSASWWCGPSVPTAERTATYYCVITPKKAPFAARILRTYDQPDKSTDVKNGSPYIITTARPRNYRQGQASDVRIFDLRPPAPIIRHITSSYQVGGSGEVRPLDNYLIWDAPEENICPDNSADWDQVMTYGTDTYNGVTSRRYESDQNGRNYVHLGHGRIDDYFWVKRRCGALGFQSAQSNVVHVQSDPFEVPKLLITRDPDASGEAAEVLDLASAILPGTTLVIGNPKIITDGIKLQSLGRAAGSFAIRAGAAPAVAVADSPWPGPADIFAVGLLFSGIAVLGQAVLQDPVSGYVTDIPRARLNRPDEEAAESGRVRDRAQKASEQAESRVSAQLERLGSVSAQAARMLARRCVELSNAAKRPLSGDGRNECETLPLYFPNEDYIPEPARLRMAALQVRPGWVIQQRRTNHDRKAWYRGEPWADAGSPAGVIALGPERAAQYAVGCPRDPSTKTGTPMGKNCDEFPNFSMQAGRSRQSPLIVPQPAIAWTDGVENRLEGESLNRLYGRCGYSGKPMENGAPFLVIPIPASVGKLVGEQSPHLCPR